MTKTCISIYNEFSNIGPTRRTWLWRLKVKRQKRYDRSMLWDHSIISASITIHSSIGAKRPVSPVRIKLQK